MEGLNNVRPKLITNNNESSFYDELILNLTDKDLKTFYFSVAFINYSGLQLLLDLFKVLEERNIKGKVITSTYLSFTDIKSLEKLKSLSNVDVKVYVTDQIRGFHTKGYIFEYKDYYKVLVGSSNITQSALKSNIEWNVRLVSKDTNMHLFIDEILTEFNQLWKETDEVTDDFITRYQAFLESMKIITKQEQDVFAYHHQITPNSMQKNALENLDLLRKNDQYKALVIAATGTGKTYLSAFDTRNFNAKRILFLVHREVILNDAMNTFKKIFPEKIMTKYQGQNKEKNAEVTFAMVPSMASNENYKTFNPDHFDYIIADEAHRAYSPTYKKLLDYFIPKFLLGMTATPERTDFGNIFELFNNNIALEVRLKDALREDLVIPFHYFGIKDIESIDYTDIDKAKIDEIADRLSIKERVDLIIEKMEHYGFDGDKRKALGFCATKAHAEFMAKEFNAFGYPSTFLTGESSDHARHEAIEQLEDSTHPLEFIFTVDIFNEGIDIPSVNLVMMLRPTESPIIFTQQLGRGLRKHHEKSFLTVLDFIGNHNKTYLIPIALSGERYYDKDKLKVNILNKFKNIPGCTNIHLDEILQSQILKQLDQINFNNMEFLKREYQEFKKVLNGKAPTIIDYAIHESAPDPTKFIIKEQTYIEFYNKMEKNAEVINSDYLEIQRSLDKQLPIKRINEFVILKEIFLHGKVSMEQAKAAILKYVVGVDDASIIHSFNYLSGSILGAKEKNPYWYIQSNNTKDILTLNNMSLINDKTIIETLNYGIIRYQEDFGKEKQIYPYLKHYQYYKMKDMGFLTNFSKSFASIRGSGVWRNGKHIYLFVDLHKGEDIKDSINYKDKLLSRFEMMWQSQNKTVQSSETGKDLCLNESRNIKLHMFIRKAKFIGNQKLDYLYVGKVNTLSCEGDKPITMKLKFETPLPQHIYEDLTLITNK